MTSRSPSSDDRAAYVARVAADAPELTVDHADRIAAILTSATSSLSSAVKVAA